MDIRIQYDCTDISWQMVSAILKSVGMAHYDPEIHRKAFESSYATVFVYDADTLIGFGRAISDGAYQAAVYDCAVIADYQGRGIGRSIIEEILAKLPDGNVILYASPGKEGFYRKLGFRKMKTGMALFSHISIMQERGFTD